MPKTTRVRLDKGAILDTTVYGERWTAIAVNDQHEFEVIVIPDGSQKVGFGYEAGLPDKVSFANPQIAIHWSTPATVGNAVFDVDISPIGDAESYDPSSPTTSVTSGAIAAPGTALLQKRTVIALTGTYTALDAILVKITRDLADVSDTIANNVHIHEAWFEAD